MVISCWDFGSHSQDCRSFAILGSHYHFEGLLRVCARAVQKRHVMSTTCDDCDARDRNRSRGFEGRQSFSSRVLFQSRWNVEKLPPLLLPLLLLLLLLFYFSTVNSSSSAQQNTSTNYHRRRRLLGHRGRCRCSCCRRRRRRCRFPTNSSPGVVSRCIHINVTQIASIKNLPIMKNVSPIQNVVHILKTLNPHCLNCNFVPLLILHRDVVFCAECFKAARFMTALSLNLSAISYSISPWVLLRSDNLSGLVSLNFG